MVRFLVSCSHFLRLTTLAFLYRFTRRVTSGPLFLYRVIGFLLAGLSDYEVRDVNDDINKLLREKRHWENQIVALGGANYRRNVPMIDEDGREVPGTKGYKCVLASPLPFSACILTSCVSRRYFGRAKELPGVKELFASKKKDEEEENLAANYYKKFLNHGPAYYGDLDETDGKLVEYEMEAEERGRKSMYVTLVGC